MEEVLVKVVEDGARSFSPYDTVVDMQETSLDESQSLFQHPPKKIKFAKEVVSGTECGVCFKNISTNKIEEHYQQNHPDRIIYDEQDEYASIMYDGYEDEAMEVGLSVFDDLDNTKLLKSTQKVPEDTYACTDCTMPMPSKIAAWHMN